MITPKHGPNGEEASTSPDAGHWEPVDGPVHINRERRGAPAAPLSRWTIENCARWVSAEEKRRVRAKNRRRVLGTALHGLGLLVLAAWAGANAGTVDGWILSAAAGIQLVALVLHERDNPGG